MVVMTDQLNEKQGQVLLQLARKTIAEKVHNKDEAEQENALPEDSMFSSQAATFVTLKIGGKLRGCIGNLQPVGSLWEGIQSNAINAAFHDHRFSPLTAEELSLVKVDISILSEAKPLLYRDPEDLLASLRPGIDGVILKCEGRSSTFLPQVWQQLTTPELFLEHLCIKAGLQGDAWRYKRPEIYIYQVQSFGEEKE